MRKPFQGVTNIIRFNRHFYSISAILFALLITVKQFVPGTVNLLFSLGVGLLLLTTALSLVVSLYVYDLSGLYKLHWLNFLQVKPGALLVNINAGFDETSSLLSEKYPHANLVVFDFYDPAKHTEISIKRARKAYGTYPGTLAVNSCAIPLKACSVDYIFAILSAHEIRNKEERILFFKTLRESLAGKGQIIVVEHLRDAFNFLAYNIGFFHFYSKKEWMSTFTSAGLTLTKEIKITPFLSAFILQTNGTAS